MQVLIILLDRHVFLFCSDFLQFFLVLLNLPQLFLGKLGQVLFGRFNEIVMNDDFPDSSDIRIVCQLRFQVKEYREQQLFLWVHHLLVKTETLDFWKIYRCLLRGYVISWKSDNRFILLVVKTIKNDGCFRRTNDHLLLNRLEFPVDSWLGLPLKLHDVLLEISHFVVLELVRFFLIVSH